MSKERDTDALLEGILIAAKNITHADGGTLYRMTEDGSALRFDYVVGGYMRFKVADIARRLETR